MHNLV